MRKILIVIIAFFTSCVYVYSDNTATIEGFVHNRITREDLVGTSISLLRNDTVVDKMTTNDNLKMSRRCVWFFDIDIDTKADYSLIFEKEGYVTYTLVLDFKKNKLKKNEERFIDDIALDKLPKEHIINGVTVKATKVKFFHRGDTIIYNADAFQMAEGSMLDALIKQLPGVELNENGEIKVNGRKVESLLLNGEKFFNGKNKVMLENLPVYMVKNVRTYEKAGIGSTLMGKEMGDKEFIMDVNLKREYSIGWIGNAEVGYGSAERYLARLFAMRFTNNSRIALYGNCNNLNDVRKPGEETSWTPENMSSGLLATKKVGADILLKSKTDLIKYEGNFELENTSIDNVLKVSKEQYFPQNSVYSRLISTNRDANIQFVSNNTLSVWQKQRKFYLEVKPTIFYKNSDNLVLNNSVDSYYNLTTNYLDSICRGLVMSNNIINRNSNKIKLKTNFLEIGMTYNVMSRMRNGNMLVLDGKISFNTENNKQLQNTRLEYPNNQKITSVIYDRFSQTKPNNNFYTNSTIKYIHSITNNFQIRISDMVEFANKIQTHDSYLLSDSLSTDRKVSSEFDFLPSEICFAEYFDSNNSFERHYSYITHTPSIMLVYNKNKKILPSNNSEGGYNVFEAFLDLPLSFKYDKLDLVQSKYSGISKRNEHYFNPSLNINYRMANGNYFEFKNSITTKQPSLIYRTPTISSENPTQIFLNENINLRNEHSYHMEAMFSRTNIVKKSFYSINISYKISQNSLAMECIYDQLTGVRFFHPENVSGNYTLECAHNFSKPLDKRKHLMLKNKINVRMNHSVDLMAETSDMATFRSSVMNHWVTEGVNFDYDITKNIKMGALGYLGYGRSSSNREDFSTITVFDFHYGLTALVSLPYNFQCSTDLTMYSRRGYANAAANTNDLVWNARLSKTFTKAGITLAVDGFDILGNISNISQVLNSQGRTETYRNSLPRYVMLHAIYRLNKQPKKK